MNTTTKLTFINSKSTRAEPAKKIPMLGISLLTPAKPIKVTSRYTYTFNLPKIILRSNRQSPN